MGPYRCIGSWCGVTMAVTRSQRSHAEPDNTQARRTGRRQSTDNYIASKMNCKGMERDNDENFMTSGLHSSQRTHAACRDSDDRTRRQHRVSKRNSSNGLYSSIYDLCAEDLSSDVKSRRGQLNSTRPRRTRKTKPTATPPSFSGQARAQRRKSQCFEGKFDSPSIGPELTGSLGCLPREALEQILGYLDPKDLATLETTCRYFLESGITDQIARHHMKNVPRAKCLQPMEEKGETSVSLLEFVQGQSAAAAQSTAVAMGTYHSVCLFSSNSARGDSYGIYSFGRGFHGQLGTGSQETTYSPTIISKVERNNVTHLYQGSKNDIRLAVVHAGSSHSAAISRRGELFMWGLASSGELGHGTWSPTEVTIPRVISNLGRTRVVSVCAGANHTLAISESGQLWSCGRGRHGQLGQGHFHDEAFLSLIEAVRNERIVSVAAGKFHSMALAADGKLFTWGAGTHGQLGHMKLDDIPLPAAVSYLDPKGLLPCDRITAIAAGGYHSMALTVSGQILGTGRNREGQLGIPNMASLDVTKFSTVPLQELYEPYEYHRAIQIQCGYLHSLALIQVQGKKELRSTGYNSYGQLGIGSQTSVSTFTKVAMRKGFEKENISSIVSGDWHCGAIAENGSFYTWGRGDCGQLGHGDDKSRWVPTKVQNFTVVHPDMTLRRSKKAPKEAIILRSPAPIVKRRKVDL